MGAGHGETLKCINLEIGGNWFGGANSMPLPTRRRSMLIPQEGRVALFPD